MHNLDEAVSGWRRQLHNAGIRNSEVLDELESHLVEEAERRIRLGVDEGTAFRTAVEQIGKPVRLEAEFSKIEEKKVMKKSLIIAAGIVGIMVGMALVLPAVAQYRHEGMMRNGEPWLFLAGSLVTLAGCGAAVRGLKKSRA
jgi:hypothetical protein